MRANEFLNELAPGNGGGGRWYNDSDIAAIVGRGWLTDMDVSGDVPTRFMLQQAQEWLESQGYQVQVLNCKLNDDDMDWYIEGSFHNPRLGEATWKSPFKKGQKILLVKQGIIAVVDGIDKNWQTISIKTQDGRRATVDSSQFGQIKAYTGPVLPSSVTTEIAELLKNGISPEEVSSTMRVPVEVVAEFMPNQGVAEAGEPTNPSRRGFLKGLAGAAATAAMPGGIANLATTAPAAATAAPAASSASIIAALFDKALSFGSQNDFAAIDDFDDDYEGAVGWDEEYEKPQGNYGDMPWGTSYEIGTTPGGVPYLHTADSDDGNIAVYIFMDDGEPQYFSIYWDRTGAGEIYASSKPEYEERYFNLEHDGEPSDIVDAVLNKTVGNVGGPSDADVADYNATAKAHNDELAAQRAAGTAPTTPYDLARLAGIAKKGYDKLTQEPAQQQKQPAPQQALPAPTGPEVLEPELGKQKQKVPVNKNASK